LQEHFFDCIFVPAMKKIFAILLGLIYLAVSSGIVVNMHYCMGKLADISYNTQTDSHCGICGMDDSGCCHDDVKVVKLEDSYKSATIINFQLPVLEALSPGTPVYTFSIHHSCPGVVSYANDPPDIQQPSLTILHSVFRI